MILEEYSLIFPLHLEHTRLPYFLLPKVQSYHNLLLSVCYQEVNLHNNQHKISNYSCLMPLSKATSILYYCSYSWNNNLLIYSPCLRNKLPYRTCNLLLELQEERFLVLDLKYQHSLLVCFHATTTVYYECLFCILLLQHLFLMWKPLQFRDDKLYES